jgi:membrane-associated protease RseP (regulator of RpoE activity)
MPEIIPPASSTTEYFRPLPVYVVERSKPRYWLHGFLLLATIFTTLVVGARMQYNFQRNLPPFFTSDESLGAIFPLHWALQGSHLLLGIPFCSTLILFFLAHEMGHYLCCRYYGVHATLPFFIPFPSFFGTMGAVILIRSPIRSRTALFDIGIAGPIAGFVVATFVLLISLPFSKLLPPGSNSEIVFGYPLIFRLFAMVLALTHIPGSLVPWQVINLHPTAIAAWIGMFATALNLLPGGQLDGGHIVYAISPRAHKQISRLTILALLPLAFYFWAGWLIWAILLRITSMRHPAVAEWPGITGGRRWLAVFALLMLVLTFWPAPFGPQGSLLDLLHQFRSGQ